MNVINEKLKGFKKLYEEAVYALCRLEEGIESWKEEIKLLPKDAARPVKVERINADIQKYEQAMPQVEARLDVLGELIKKYEKLLKGQK